MDLLSKELYQSLETGFINHIIHSKKEYLPELLRNDKQEGIKFLTAVNRELKVGEI